jgi:hypothetical protein
MLPAADLKDGPPASRHPAIEEANAHENESDSRVGVGIIVGAILAAGTLKIYFIRDDSGGEVLWNGKEAYLFISVSQRGFRMSYLKYPWVLIQQYLHSAPLPDAEHFSGMVIRVTTSTVERHTADLGDLYTPIDGQIYANCRGDLCKWAIDHFEPATQNEKQQLNGINRLSGQPFDNVDGWSKRSIGAGPEAIFARSTVNVGGQFTLSEESEPIGRTGYAAVSISLQRPGRSPERIWYLDGHPRRVSRVEYQGVFRMGE